MIASEDVITINHNLRLHLINAEFSNFRELFGALMDYLGDSQLSSRQES